MDFPATLDAVRRMCLQYPGAIKKLVEEKANGAGIIAMLNKEFAGFIPINPKSSKEARASAVSPAFESGNVYIPHPSSQSWVAAYVQEVTTFPAAADDDQVDATSQALDELILHAGPPAVVGWINHQPSQWI